MKRQPDGKHFVAIKEVEDAPSILWELLEERQPHQNISHRRMPTAEEHLAFVSRHPYRVWYFIKDARDFVGAAYLTKHNEIGVFVFMAHRGKGYGKWAVEEMLRRFPGRMYANVAPTNPDSQAFFEKLGFRHIQNTLVIGPTVTAAEQLTGRR